MASDIVKFESETFLTSLREAKAKLPDSLCKEFQPIEGCIVDAIQTNVWSYDASSSLLPLLNDLNDLLAECIDFADQSPGVSETISTLNPLRRLFIRNMKQSLKTKKEDLERQINGLLEPESEISGSTTTSVNFFPTGRHTSFESTTDSSQLIGIDEQEKQIRDLISEKEYRVIGVYGIAGSGKTALIHKVVNSFRKKFSRVIWLCLSDILSKEDEEFEVNIVKFMLCELDCDVDRWTDMDPSMAELLKRLKEELLKSNKYLIVFDDVWEENEFYSNLGDVRGGNTNTDGNGNKLWEALPRDTGGKIIITSRLKEVAEKMVGEKNLIHMKPLNNENCRMIVEDGIGFLGYAKEIEDLLINRSGFVAIGIHGPSSSAKTALVRKVLGSPSVREKFECKIWVPVSQIFLKHIVQTDAKAIENIEKEIVKYMLKELKLGAYYLKILDADYFDIDDLQAICESLRPQKYLIVLIDVWHKNYGYRTEDKRNDVWKKLSRVWPKDGEGTVIVTSEAKEVAEMLVGEKKNLVHVRLPELGSSETSEVASDHQYISDELVNQCNGLPLAAKTLANIIREKYLHQS